MNYEWLPAVIILGVVMFWNLFNAEKRLKRLEDDLKYFSSECGRKQYEADLRIAGIQDDLAKRGH